MEKKEMNNMHYDVSDIDIERLRKDLQEECFGAFLSGGFGGAMIGEHEIEKASPEKLVKLCKQMGVDLDMYEI
jgi:hypothetical protein